MSGGPQGTMPPLDLKAVEVWLHAAINGVEYAGAVDDVTALLAHAHALRAALQRLHNVALRVTLVPSGATAEWLLALDEATTVLGAAQDGPA